MYFMSAEYFCDGGKIAIANLYVIGLIYDIIVSMRRFLKYIVH